ncbi:hypothetical protein GCM10008083_07120 [Ulvibacter litoralis]|nr:hypothetical protein GCM10008083_07120 [Ulvibacter litoralis]
MIGPTILQGPHHAAQKSTTTGLSLFNTVSSNVASVISKAILFVLITNTKVVKKNSIPYNLYITLDNIRID